MTATIRGDTAMADLLLTWGVNVNAQDEEGVTALMIAARDGNAALVQRLLDRGATVDVRTRLGWTALTYAALQGYPHVARRLLSAGADPTLRDRSGWTPLMHASSRAAEASAAEPSAKVDALHAREPRSLEVACRRYAEVIDLLGSATKGRGTNRTVARESPPGDGDHAVTYPVRLGHVVNRHGCRLAREAAVDAQCRITTRSTGPRAGPSMAIQPASWER